MRNIVSFPMLIFVYSLKLKVKSVTFLYNIHWKMRYRTVCIQNGDIMTFSAWISADPKADISQQTLRLMCNIFPTFVKK